MHKRITFRGMEHTPILEEHINKQLAKFDRLLSHERTPIYIDFVLDSERAHHHHRAEVLIKTPNYDLFAHYECPDMYEAIDKTIDKMLLELHKAKEKRVDEHKK